MPYLRFDIAKLEKLNDPGRFDDLRPEVMWKALGATARVGGRAISIVEIGAGTGLFASRFAELAPGATVYAVDSEPRMVEWIRDNRPEVAEGALVPVLSSETHVPLPDEVADAIVMINLHHELADAPATYGEAFRLLRPAGRILVADWAPRETRKGPPLAVRATEEQLLATVMGAGFEGAEAHAGALPDHSLVTATKPR